MAERDIDHLIASHNEMSASFDRTLTALAGGSLTLSISFINNIAPKPTSVWAIRSSWISMAVALALILVSFLVSIEVHKRVIAAGGSYESEPEWIARIVTGLNWLAGLSFLFGAGLLVFFAYVNIN
jgi:hypothetical protein